MGNNRNALNEWQDYVSFGGSVAGEVGQFADMLATELARVSAENSALRAAFGSLRDRLTEVAVQAEDAVIAINMDSVSASQVEALDEKGK